MLDYWRVASTAISSLSILPEVRGHDVVKLHYFPSPLHRLGGHGFKARDRQNVFSHKKFFSQRQMLSTFVYFPIKSSLCVFSTSSFIFFSRVLWQKSHGSFYYSFLSTTQGFKLRVENPSVLNTSSIQYAITPAGPAFIQLRSCLC